MACFVPLSSAGWTGAQRRGTQTKGGGTFQSAAKKWRKLGENLAKLPKKPVSSVWRRLWAPRLGKFWEGDSGEKPQKKGREGKRKPLVSCGFQIVFHTVQRENIFVTGSVARRGGFPQPEVEQAQAGVDERVSQLQRMPKTQAQREARQRPAHRQGALEGAALAPLPARVEKARRTRYRQACRRSHHHIRRHLTDREKKVQTDLRHQQHYTHEPCSLLSPSALVLAQVPNFNRDSGRTNENAVEPGTTLEVVSQPTQHGFLLLFEEDLARSLPQMRIASARSLPEPRPLCCSACCSASWAWPGAAVLVLHHLAFFLSSVTPEARVSNRRHSTSTCCPSALRCQ